MNKTVAAIQSVLREVNPSLEIDGEWGPASQAALDAVLRARQAPVWPFNVTVAGDDIVVEGVITCFGGWGTGIADPMDNGDTASGLSTRTQPIKGVSIPMDGRQFSNFSVAEHRALDGCPIPRLLNSRGLTAWHTPVEVTIDRVTWTPPDGIVDLGPGLQASQPDAPHVLDLSVLAALHFNPQGSLRQLANSFETRGSYRIIGGAKLVPTGWTP